MRRTCAAAGRTIRELRIRHETGAIVIALRKSDGSFDTTPEPDTPIEVGDVLIGVGSPDEIAAARGSPSPLGETVAGPRSLGQIARCRGRRHVAGAELELEAARRRPSTATTRRTVALQARRSGDDVPPRQIAAEIAQSAAVGLGGGRPRRGRRKPGFVNLFLRDDWFAATLGEILADGDAYGAGGAEQRERVQVEMVSANPTGPITVASARNGAYGDSVARLFDLAGHAVEREYYYNDSGGQMERFRASVEAARRGEEPPEDGYAGAYIDDLAALRGDPVLADAEGRSRRLARALPHPLRQLAPPERARAAAARVAAAARHVREGRSALGTVVGARRRGRPRSPALGRPHARPIAAAGTSAYISWTSSNAASDRAIYVLGADHHGTRNWYSGRRPDARLRPWRGVEVLLYQLVHLTKGGQQTKMSKRRGDVVFLDDFMDEIGVDAARWYLVNRGPDQTIEIDVDLAAERSQKNPVYYVQYAHARIAGILRNAPGNAGNSLLPAGSLAPEERELVKRLAELPAVVADATAKRGPQGIPAYAIRVADDFHRFYHEHRVLASKQESFRLGLCRATQTVIARCLQLVGVEAPDRM